AVSPTTCHGLPPYSWSRLRTFHGAGSTSSTAPLAPSRTSATRPPSAGLDSAHHTLPPSVPGPPDTTSSHCGVTPAAATSAASIGEDQVPQGAIAGMRDSLEARD